MTTTTATNSKNVIDNRRSASNNLKLEAITTPITTAATGGAQIQITSKIEATAKTTLIQITTKIIRTRTLLITVITLTSTITNATSTKTMALSTTTSKTMALSTTTLKTRQ